MTLSRALLVGVLLLGSLAGCQRSDDPATNPLPDSLAVSPLDSLLADSVALDSLAALDTAGISRPDGMIFTPEPAVVRDTVYVPSPPDTIRLPADADVTTAALLDSLLREVNRLRANVRPDTVGTAAADTSLVQRLEEQAENVRNVTVLVLNAIALLIVTVFLVRGLVWLLEALAERSATRRLFFKKLIPIVRIVTYSVVAYFIIAIIFDVDRESLLAASAALGVAIGFAAQDVLKNIFGGLIIIFDQPFQAGDKISVGGTYGEVVSIGLRSTRIVTPDDNLVSVPNAQVVDGQVSNANAGALDCQVVTNLYLPGWVDVMEAKSIAYQAAATSKYVFLDKPIVVLVKDDFKETFLTQLVVKAYVLDTRFESVFSSDVTETAKAEFLKRRMFGSLKNKNLFFDPGADLFYEEEDDPTEADNRAPLPPSTEPPEVAG